MRNLVLGLEVVLPNGDIWNGNSALLKNTAGYDLKQFFIGSEGTLGIITKATLKLSSKPKGKKIIRSKEFFIMLLRTTTFNMESVALVDNEKKLLQHRPSWCIISFCNISVDCCICSNTGLYAMYCISIEGSYIGLSIGMLFVLI